MAKTREIQCIHYICEGNCDLGKEGNVPPSVPDLQNL